ncbi:four helix bundle protein [Cerasicoccus frondis]|uniref:four helix bundle protein n=1 Tax=Cerasicoccus frondis TaxID=490090 RepID=UPI002852CAC1|nr:four helix bundle protein [Cerasicoccus frondis]
MAKDQKLADQIEERLIDFAVRIIRLTKALPRDEVGIHIAKQLMRSGTSPAPNYAEARGAESRADFIHKLGIVQKELNESKVWLRIIERAELLSADRLQPITTEAHELSRIIQASIKTLRSKNDK